MTGADERPLPDAAWMAASPKSTVEVGLFGFLLAAPLTVLVDFAVAFFLLLLVVAVSLVAVVTVAGADGFSVALLPVLSAEASAVSFVVVVTTIESDGFAVAFVSVSVSVSVFVLVLLGRTAVVVALTSPLTAVAAAPTVFFTALTTRLTGFKVSPCFLTPLVPLVAERVTALPCLVSVCASGKLPSGGSKTKARKVADTSSQNTHKKSKTALSARDVPCEPFLRTRIPTEFKRDSFARTFPARRLVFNSAVSVLLVTMYLKTLQAVEILV
jgi:hypothetical protein